MVAALASSAYFKWLSETNTLAYFKGWNSTILYQQGLSKKKFYNIDK
jgi:hypothetical protein